MSILEEYFLLFKWRNKSQSAIKAEYLKHVKYECRICKITEWNNKPITLVMDHIDGNNKNNHISNLQLICNNCDSQLTTYKGRNKKNNKSKKEI